MSSTMAIAADSDTETDGMPRELLVIIIRYILKTTRIYLIKAKFIDYRRKTPLHGHWLVPASAATASVGMLDPYFHKDFYNTALSYATSSKKPTKMVAYVKNLDFRPLTNFLKNGLSTFSATHQKSVSDSAEPKFIAILEFDGDEIKAKEFGQWLGFIDSSEFRIEYMMGRSDKPETRVEQLQNMLRGSEHSDAMYAIYKAGLIGATNTYLAAKRVKALYEDLSEAEADAEDEDAFERAIAARVENDKATTKYAEYRMGKGTGLGALFGEDTTRNANEGKGEVSVQEEDGSSEEYESDSDPENMSSEDDEE